MLRVVQPAYAWHPAPRTRHLGMACEACLANRLSSSRRSAADAEGVDQLLVPALVDPLDVIEKRPAGLHQLQQAAARMVVLAVNLEVLGEIVDAFTEDRNLHLGRTGVALLGGIFGDERALALGRDRHRMILSNGGFGDAWSRDVVQDRPCKNPAATGFGGHIGEMWPQCQRFRRKHRSESRRARRGAREGEACSMPTVPLRLDRRLRPAIRPRPARARGRWRWSGSKTAIRAHPDGRCARPPRPATGRPYFRARWCRSPCAPMAA